jgi:type IV secretory pathway ATPase VirB11/archaellum biosynthesis ATPase
MGIRKKLRITFNARSIQLILALTEGIPPAVKIVPVEDTTD